VRGLDLRRDGGVAVAVGLRHDGIGGDHADLT
jgi:hypothetical protein